MADKFLMSYTASGKSVMIPDKKVEPTPFQTYVPLRGYGFMLGVYDSAAKKFVGHVTTDALGFHDVKEWMAKTGWKPRAGLDGLRDHQSARGKVKHFTVRDAGNHIGSSWRIQLEAKDRESLRGDEMVEALVTHRFDYTDDAAAAGQALFPHATYGVS